MDFGDTLDLHLARVGAHAGAAGGARDAGNPLHGVAVDFPGFYQGHFKIAARPGVAFHEHVVGNDAEFHLGLPESCPDIGIVVDVGQQGALGPDLRAGFADAPDGFPGNGRFQLPPVIVVRHQRQMFAGCLDFTEQ